MPDVGEAVATYWEKVGIKVKRRPVDRAVFAADFRARAYSGVTLAYAAPLVAPESWEVLIRAGYTKAALNLFVEHPKLDEFIDRLAVQPNYQERVRIMRDEMGPWLYEYVPGVAIGAAHAIAGVGPKVGRLAADPGPHGLSQLGVRDPRPLERRRGPRRPHSNDTRESRPPASPAVRMRRAAMKRRSWITALIVTAALWTAIEAPGQAARPEGTLTVAVATFGNERWLPNLYVGRGGRGPQAALREPARPAIPSGEPHPHAGRALARSPTGAAPGRSICARASASTTAASVTAEDVKFTFASIAKDGSANSLAPEFRMIKSMEVEGPHTITVRFDKPFVTFGNRVTHGLFASVAYIQSKKHIETAGERRRRATARSAPGPGSSSSTSAAIGSSTRPWRTTGARCPTGSGWCS